LPFREARVCIRRRRVMIWTTSSSTFRSPFFLEKFAFSLVSFVRPILFRFPESGRLLTARVFFSAFFLGYIIVFPDFTADSAVSLPSLVVFIQGYRNFSICIFPPQIGMVV